MNRRKIFTEAEKLKMIEGVNLGEVEEFIDTAIKTTEHFAELYFPELLRAFVKKDLKGIIDWGSTTSVATALKLSLLGKDLDESQQAKVLAFINTGMERAVKESTDDTKDTKEPIETSKRMRF